MVVHSSPQGVVWCWGPKGLWHPLATAANPTTSVVDHRFLNRIISPTHIWEMLCCMEVGPACSVLCYAIPIPQPFSIRTLLRYSFLFAHVCALSSLPTASCIAWFAHFTW
jgi:hypothetical protein